MSIAYVREVPDAINECELTFLDRVPIDVGNARDQHDRYVAALEANGVDVRFLPPLHQHPDSVFVEDTALVLDEVAVITRPGAESRRAEVETTEQALAHHRPIARVAAPATIDGGDITVVGREVFVGLTSRSTPGAIDQLRTIVQPFGYAVTGVPVNGCLHLKSAVTAIGPSALLANPEYVDLSAFEHLDLIEVHPDEHEAANAVWLGGVKLIYGAEYPKTRTRLEQAGYDVVSVPASEVAKAEGAVTCCSLLVR